MEKQKRIISVRNAYGQKVKKCCASCLHKDVDIEGNRICTVMQLKVQSRFKCKQWQMSEGLQNAGKWSGVVRKLTEVAIE